MACIELIQKVLHEISNRLENAIKYIPFKVVKIEVEVNCNKISGKFKCKAIPIMKLDTDYSKIIIQCTSNQENHISISLEVLTANIHELLKYFNFTQGFTIDTVNSS